MCSCTRLCIPVFVLVFWGPESGAGFRFQSWFWRNPVGTYPDVPAFQKAGTQFCTGTGTRSGLIRQDSGLPTCVGAGTPPISEVRIFTVHSPHTQINAPLSIIATMARIDHNSDFECIKERHYQVYAIERELIIFMKLIVVNKAQLWHFDKHSLHSASDVCLICTAECRASLVKVALLPWQTTKGSDWGRYSCGWSTFYFVATCVYAHWHPLTTDWS